MYRCVSYLVRRPLVFDKSSIGMSIKIKTCDYEIPMAFNYLRHKKSEQGNGIDELPVKDKSGRVICSFDQETYRKYHYAIIIMRRFVILAHD